jgi:hypothetical protein
MSGIIVELAKKLCGTTVYKRESSLEQKIDMLYSTVITPILQSDTTDLEKSFDRILSNSQLNFLVHGIAPEPALGKRADKLEKVARSRYLIYEDLKRFIEKDQELNQDIRARILQVAEKISDFDNIVTGIDINRPDQLVKALREIDRHDLRWNVNSALVSFFCIISLIKDKKHDKKKLSKLLSLAEKYSENIETYADTLDILSNPEVAKALKT